jgi:beta-glucosidase-like glycosyl hydrolase
MRNYYEVIVPRLNGADIRDDFKRCLSLVRKGIAGFIIFGGALGQVRRYVKRLQEEAPLPLIIASDLERGLGQQLKGATIFPPAMAIASAFSKTNFQGNGLKHRELSRKSFSSVAAEAAYAGINTIFAPVLDINTNPKNPIIAARSFGEDVKTVSYFGSEMIREVQAAGIAACGKHFPGHGDTEVDSHVMLPSVNRSLRSLAAKELKPFQRAIDEGVRMIMLGHLSVPAIDPSGVPVSLSEKAVAYLRRKMGFGGIVITDAMNMGGIGKYSEEEAARMALDAGVDIILHPSDPDRIVRHLEKGKTAFDDIRLAGFRKSLLPAPVKLCPDFDENRKLSRQMTELSIRMTGTLRTTGRPVLVMLDDEEEEKGRVFARAVRRKIPCLQIVKLRRDSAQMKIMLPAGASALVAVFSETKAWKGGASNWLFRVMKDLERSADLFISFGSPYLLDSVKGGAKIFAYCDSDDAQESVADLVARRLRSCS